MSKLNFLSIVLFSSFLLTACVHSHVGLEKKADTESLEVSPACVQLLEGTLTIGHEVRTFSPTDSTKTYWIVDKTGELYECYDQTAGGVKSARPLKAKLKVINRGKSQEGFAQSYIGVLEVHGIESISVE